jgi:hypothetical protein
MGSISTTWYWSSLVLVEKWRGRPALRPFFGHYCVARGLGAPGQKAWFLPPASVRRAPKAHPGGHFSGIGFVSAGCV